jgi:hypothetical protein
MPDPAGRANDINVIRGYDSHPTPFLLVLLLISM